MTKEEYEKIESDLKKIVGNGAHKDWFIELVEYVYSYANPPTLEVSVDENVKADENIGG